MHSHHISPELLDRIKAIPIEDLLEAEGATRRGRAWRCLFHDDSTPSASVHDNRFRCFACGKSWDPIDLVMERTGMGFRDAVAELGRRYGIPIGDQGPDPRWERARKAAEALEAWRRERLEEIRRRLWGAYSQNNRACRWLRGHPAAGWESLTLQAALIVQSRTEADIWRLQEERERLERAGARELLDLIKGNGRRAA